MTENRGYIFLLFAFIALLVSGCSSRTGPAPVVRLGKHSGHNVIKRPIVNSKYYIVKKDDTLYSIAFSAGRDFREIAQINGISKPYSIYPGQKITLIPSNNRQQKNTPNFRTKTTKNKPIQTVDRKKKKAYGKYVKRNAAQKKSSFPSEISQWTWPSKGKIINKFSLAAEGNKGLDIAGSKGDPVKAAADGKVVYTGNALRGYGNLVIIKHSESYLSAYAHNDTIIVKEQQWVKAGQRVAHMGNSGTDQTMLHFEIRYKGKSVDPLRYLPK
ncbi:peptidoglycan DD-metalloendopeptidase family protein [Alteromonas sp. a30]|uniref:peptidoglycan DD-metalloendopeptidase family protein n=1 Tax=Alteromonas sp. a30 TaxID=2730917 RepID=UPI00227F9D62|nr:peptidoglycan DD-metalloendopeptidase family protein [Alteromonas sp. a30]MCY7294286.1 peptidoglycan DD-metalloendopeptidase family protein [Alteromonas sp. a30]